MRQLLYDSNTPASVAAALQAAYPSGFGSHLEQRPEGTVNHEPSYSQPLCLKPTLLPRYVGEDEIPMGSRRNRGATLARTSDHSPAEPYCIFRWDIYLFWGLCRLQKLVFFHNRFSCGVDNASLRTDRSI